MLLVQYYRLYIVLYIYSFTLLLLIAVGIDTHSFLKTNVICYGRVVTTVICALFAYAALVFQHMFLEKIMAMDELKMDRFYWVNKFLKIKKRKTRMKAKFFRKSSFFFIHLALLFLIVLPLLCGEILQMFAPEHISKHIYSRVFAMIGILLRSFLWILTLAFAKLLLFRNKKRKLELV